MAFLIGAAIRGSVSAVQSGIQAHKDFNNPEGPQPRTDSYGNVRPAPSGPVYGLVMKAEKSYAARKNKGEGGQVGVASCIASSWGRRGRAEDGHRAWTLRAVRCSRVEWLQCRRGDRWRKRNARRRKLPKSTYDPPLQPSFVLIHELSARCTAPVLHWRSPTARWSTPSRGLRRPQRTSDGVRSSFRRTARASPIWEYFQLELWEFRREGAYLYRMSPPHPSF